MEEIAFSDWPGPDLSGSNPWLPAYGFHQPHALLQKEDFAGNPDADLFLQGGTHHYMYLETIQEENSDDLQSESDRSGSRASPVGWLATDSESGSVIRIDALHLDEIDCESERELACPAKRRRHDNAFYSDDESNYSLSRSSSLLQFESLEKQCQDISSSSPSILSSFSFDSLERKHDQSPDSLEEPESDYYKTLKVDLPRKKRDSTDSDSSEDSERTLEKSTSSLKVRSLENIHHKTRSSDNLQKKTSSENLSEDSGYSDHPWNRSSSNPNISKREDREERRFKDVEFFSAASNFGSSCHDLTVLDKYISNDLERLKRRSQRTDVIIEKAECDDDDGAKFSAASASEPNLQHSGSAPEAFLQDTGVSSVPKDLNLAGALQWDLSGSIAAKNYDIADLEHVNDKMAFAVYKEADFQREGSFLDQRADSSDDEHNPCYTDNIRHSTIVDFERSILKTISETSIQNNFALDLMFSSTPISGRNVVSTPNLYKDGEAADTSAEPRKSSLTNRSTSTSGVTDEDQPLCTRSLGGSAKGVHFCPVVAEVKWHDDTSETTTEKESSYSLSSTPEPDLPLRPPTPPLARPKPRLPSISSSEPELPMNNNEVKSDDRSMTSKTKALSQPDVGDSRRRGSKIFHQDVDGSLAASYVDEDGVQYPHSHLGAAGPPTSHVAASRSAPKTEPQPRLPKKEQHASMEPPPAPKRGRKLGGFFSRLASFRFSSRDKKKKKDAAEAKSAAFSAQRVATKADYIYIPLKPPPEAQQVECLSAKPPLPKLPPRVVGASVKRRGGGDASAQPPPALPESRHRSIDSGLPRPMEPMGLIETDLDTEVTVITSGVAAPHVKTRSLMNLGAEAPPRTSLAAPQHNPARPHKSMEFLLDKQNLKVVEFDIAWLHSDMEYFVQMPGDLPYNYHKKQWVRLSMLWEDVIDPLPPENELQKGERVMSEHQLRIQRSLQKLTIPDWYKQYTAPREGFLLKKATGRERWPGTSTKTPSLNSLGSAASPLVLSPTPQAQPFVRWSTSKLNSTASSPCASTRSSFNTRQPNGSISPSSIRSSFSYRQPYLGWRSQERLARPRTPAERLASSILTQPPPQQESPEIQTSIKEVTSAIVHYVSGLKPEEPRSASASPRGSQKLCWLESSFVGTRPLDTPQTPVTLSESHASTPPSSLRLELQKTHNDVSSLHTGPTKPSPSSTTLEDVLDSLLGLPPSTRAPSPSHQETASANTSPSRLGEESRAAEQFRRHSEGSEPPRTSMPRRVSFHSSPVVRCRYSRCGRVVSAASNEAQTFKHCHNCSYMYCSRACRRAHWEKHRKSCLFSRVGTLCRQVLAAAKEQRDTLLQISLIARRGYLSHGVGAVKCFFPCPEAAEKFLTGGLPFLGELTYVRWTDLMPTEMGAQMYTELVKMCKNYNPDTKLVLYVTVCVVSETPATGAVKWERQLVSRCAKMRLSKDVPIQERDTTENLETLVLTCTPTRDPASRGRVFSRIQNQLKIKGVSLRRQYPEVYQQLCAYVEGKGQQFVPVTVYPRDDVSGKSFMCIIMLDSDPEVVRQVAAAGVPVNTVNLLQNCDL